MNSNADFQLSSQAPTDFLQELGAELVFTQDASGKYLSFYWQQAENYKLNPEKIVGCQMSETFGPVAIAPYLDRVRRALDGQMPERFSYPFAYAEQYFPFDLVISPVLTANGKATKVLVMGRLLPHKLNAQAVNSQELVAYPALASNLDLHQKMLIQIAGSIRRTLPPSSELYHKILSQIAQNVRRTLDLKTIWQQTVNSLGQVLGVTRCIICSYKEEENYDFSELNPKFKVVAEYCQEAYSSMLGLELSEADQPGWSQALATLEPVAVERTPDTKDPFERFSVLVAATSYQDQPNALICLHQCNTIRRWSAVEVEFVRELAVQVGTAIAHATLYQELEQARAEAVALSQLKSQFLANTSHELRTPLNGMLGFLKLVMDGMADDPEEEHQFIQEAYRSALHLLNLINDVLDIAKIEAGKMELELTPIKINELLQEVENFTQAQLQQKQLNFKIQKPATQDEIIVYGNYQRLLQVMLNLVGNAIKFTHEGGISISMELIKKKIVIQNRELPGLVKIRVADTGIGVSLDKQDKLFQSFFQVDGDRTRQYGGTGLGLAISQKLVEAMRGTVNFYSMGEGLGSTVTFTIPLYQEPIMISTQSAETIEFFTID
ncbi:MULTISPECIES: ATP-binding protein [Kamptonema]|uniref:ATP-binding protein n=1 Tax=Kamptonema TaxID=1501433 RepID=UPI0001DAC342|nr:MULTISPECIES: ATP-binding protein [Kamptonema]CBN59011.1 two-component sensor histidine kinase [Kamptonema sp. PCC 6506]